VALSHTRAIDRGIHRRAALQLDVRKGTVTLIKFETNEILAGSKQVSVVVTKKGKMSSPRERG